jgi:hypothetical protein
MKKFGSCVRVTKSGTEAAVRKAIDLTGGLREIINAE